ncbi:hypothetical protein STRIP9103_09111, partial [Streptomyces ipomoeae 91-03]
MLLRVGVMGEWGG